MIDISLETVYGFDIFIKNYKKIKLHCVTMTTMLEQ